jgi:hypothetical protein
LKRPSLTMPTTVAWMLEARTRVKLCGFNQGSYRTDKLKTRNSAGQPSTAGALTRMRRIMLQWSLKTHMVNTLPPSMFMCKVQVAVGSLCCV